MARTFIDAGAQSTSPGAITAAQTTLTLQSTANFGSPSVALPSSVVILDSGNPAYNPGSPLATPFEYQLITNNNTGTNVLTINNGVRSGYAGTTPHAFFAGATVAGVFLAEDINSTLMQQIGDSGDLNGQTAASFASIPQGFGSLLLVAKLKHNAAVGTANVGIRFNSDSTSPHYFSQSWFGANAGPSYFNTTDQSQVQQALLSAGTTNSDFAASALLIPGYAQSDPVHNTLQLGSHFQVLQLNGGLWSPSSSQAITRIDTLSPGAAFLTGSRIRLYGLP